MSNIKNSKIDGMVDIIVADDNSPRVNRIAERFNFRDVATIQKELELEKQEKEKIENAKDKTTKFIDEIMPKEEKKEITFPSNINETEEKSQLGSDLNMKQNSNEIGDFNRDKKSVKKELKEIEKELKVNEKTIEKEAGSITKNKKKENKYDKKKNVPYVKNGYKQQESFADNNRKGKKVKLGRNSR